MKSFVLIAFVALSFTSCRAPSLDERLAGKTGEDRETELHNACIERANYSIPGGHNAGYIGHEARMWAICDAMHETNVATER